MALPQGSRSPEAGEEEPFRLFIRVRWSPYRFNFYLRSIRFLFNRTTWAHFKSIRSGRQSEKTKDLGRRPALEVKGDSMVNSVTGKRTKLVSLQKIALNSPFWTVTWWPQLENAQRPTSFLNTLALAQLHMELTATS